MHSLQIFRIFLQFSTLFVTVIITEGGTATNIIPARAKMELSCRAATLGELKQLQSQVEACITAAAIATNCTAEPCFEESNAYHNMLSNRVLSELYKSYSERLGKLRIFLDSKFYDKFLKLLLDKSEWNLVA